MWKVFSTLCLLLSVVCRADETLSFEALDLGFESEPTQWRQNNGAPLDRMEVIKSDPKRVRSGEHAMHLQRSGKRATGEPLEGHCHTLNSIPVDRAASYRVSVFAKGEGSVVMGVYLYKQVDGNEAFQSTANLAAFDGKPLPALKSEGDWQELVFRFDASKLPPEAKTVRFVIQASGDVMVDDVSITPLNAAGKSESVAAKSDDQTARPNLITVGTAKTAPKLDGVLSNNEYPTMLSGLIDNETRDLYPYGNRVGMSFDDQNLYLALELHLPPGYQMGVQGSGRDDSSMVASADTLFLMLRDAAQPTATAYKGAYTSVDSAGHVYDAMEEIDWKGGSCVRDVKFNVEWSVKCTVSKDGVWTAELSAPWKSLQLPTPKPGEKLLMSFGIKLRNRVLTWQSFSNWFDHYSAFGVFRFDPAAVRVQLNELAGLARGAAKPSFELTNASNAEKKYDLMYVIAKPRMVGGGVGGWVYDTALDARRKEIVRGQSVYLWDRSGTLAAGKTVSESDSKQLTEPAYHVLEAEARVDGEPVFYQRIPFQFVPPIRVSLSPIPSRKIVEASLDLRGAAPEEREEMRIDILGADGKSAHKQSVKLSGPELIVSLPIGDLKPGDYQIAMVMLDAVGKQASKISTPFTKPIDPEWLTNPAGVESRSPDWVPTPWTPMVVKDNTVSVWARSFQYDKGSLIAGISAQDRKVLASAAAIKYMQGGKEVSVDIQSPKINQLGKGRVEVKQTGASPGFKLSSTQLIEFDGMNLIDLTLTPNGNVDVESMWVEIPIADAQMTVMQARLGISSHWWQRGVPDDATYGTPRRYDSIWLGNEDAGLSYFLNNYKGWLIDSRQPRVRLKSDGNTRTLKLMLVNVPTKVSGEMKVQFGVQPTPFRPVLPTARGFRPNSDWIGKHTNMYLTHSSAWNSTDSKPSPRNWEMFNQLVTHHHKNGMRIHPYIATYQLAPWEFYRVTVPFNLRRESFPPEWICTKKSDGQVLPEYVYYQRDWETTPRLISPADPETRELASMAAGTSYDDYFAGGVRDMLTKSDFEGFFMDISCPVLNFDESRGQVYTTLDGVREGTFDGLATRDLYKRLYWLFEKYRGEKRRPWMIGHNLPSSAPYSMFWDLTVNGEEIKPLTAFEFTQLSAAQRVTGSPMAQVAPGESDVTKDPIAWRAAFGKHFGVMNIILPQYGYKPELKTRETARETLSVTFLHNQIVWPGFIAADIIYDFWDKVEVPFGLSDAVFHGYWSNGTKTGNPAVRTSYWKKNGKESYLLAVSNWNNQRVETDVQLPKDFVSVGEITDMESGEVITLKAGRFTVALPPHDLRVFRCQK